MRDLTDEKKEDLEKEIAMYLEGRTDLSTVVDKIKKYQESQYDTCGYWHKLSEAINQKIFGRYKKKDGNGDGQDGI